MNTIPAINAPWPLPGMECTRMVWSNHERPRLIRHAPTFWQWLMGATAYYTVETFYDFSVSCTYEPSGEVEP